MMRMAVLGATVNLVGSIIATFWLGPIGPAIGSLPAVLVIDFTILPDHRVPLPRRPGRGGT